MQTDSTVDEIPIPDPHTSHRLYSLGLLGLIGAMVGLTHASPVKDVLLLTLGNAVLVLAAAPALLWARRGELHFPVFEMFMLTAIPFYAMPLLRGHPAAIEFSEAATFEAGLSLLAFLGGALVSFLNVKVAPAKSPHLTTTLLPGTTMQYAVAGMWLYTAYLFVAGFTTIIPQPIATIARAALAGAGNVALFIVMRRWGARQLSSAQKFPIVFNLLLQIVMLFRELYLIVGLSLLLLATLGYVSTSRRLPIGVMVIVLPIIAVLHNGKATMRAEYWDQRLPAPTAFELPGYFARWFEKGLEIRSDEADQSASLAGRLFERASLFQMLCLVTERTPEFEPFLAGESYKYVLAQMVPRQLWPDKPSSLESNIKLAVHYKLVPEDNPSNVSIAFGMVAEAYANFGLIGCGVFGLLLGFGYKRISGAAVGCPQFSAMGLFTILLAAWSFQVEQIFATWIVSLFQASVTVIGLPMIFRALFRQD